METPGGLASKQDCADLTASGVENWQTASQSWFPDAVQGPPPSHVELASRHWGPSRNFFDLT